MATSIRPKDLPEAPTIPSDTAIIVDTGDGVFKTRPDKIGEKIVAKTLADLKAASTASPGTAIYDQATFQFTIGDYTGQADDDNIIKSDYIDLDEGAWVRQGADKVRAALGGTVQNSLDRIFSTRTQAAAQLLTALPNGSVAWMGGRQYKVDSSATGEDSCTNDLGVDGLIPFSTVEPEHFGDCSVATAGNPTDAERTATTAAFDRAMKYAAANAVAGKSSGAYYLNGTVAPRGAYKWDWGVTDLYWDTSETDNFSEVMENPSGSEYTPSGKYVAFDIAEAGGSVNEGSVTMTGYSPGNMKAASRANIPANFVAVTCSDIRPGDGIRWGALVMVGWGYAFWQGSMQGSARALLPYTRLAAGLIIVRFCLNSFESGEAGNGFDDWAVGAVQIARCAGRLRPIGTDLNIASLFLMGLREDDYEDQTIALTADSTTATLSADSTYVDVGTVLAFPAGKTNKAGDSIGWTTSVAAKDGTTLTLASAPGASVAAANFVIDPPNVSVVRSRLNIQHLYIERFWDKGIEVGVGGSVTAASFKVSGGVTAFRYGAPITVRGRSDCSVDIGLHPISQNNPSVRSLVGVGSQRNVAVYSDCRINVRTGGLRGVTNVKSDPVAVVALQSADLDPGYTECSSDYNQNMSLSVDYADGTVWMAGHVGAVDSYVSGPRGGYESAQIADIADATVTGGFGAVSDGASVKTAGTTGQLRLVSNLIEGARYRVSLGVADYTTGAPTLQLNDSSATLIKTMGAMARANGRFIAFFDAPASVAQVAIFGFSGDDYTVNEFTLDRVLTP